MPPPEERNTKGFFGVGEISKSHARLPLRQGKTLARGCTEESVHVPCAGHDSVRLQSLVDTGVESSRSPRFAGSGRRDRLTSPDCTSRLDFRSRRPGGTKPLVPAMRA